MMLTGVFLDNPWSQCCDTTMKTGTKHKVIKMLPASGWDNAKPVLTHCGFLGGDGVGLS